MGLSPRERLILNRIEHLLSSEDPVLSARLADLGRPASPLVARVACWVLLAGAMVGAGLLAAGARLHLVPLAVAGIGVLVVVPWTVVGVLLVWVHRHRGRPGGFRVGGTEE